MKVLRNILISIAVIIIIIFSLYLMVIFEIRHRDSSLKECLENLPTETEVINKIKRELVTSKVEIAGYKLEGDNLIYTVEIYVINSTWARYIILYKPQLVSVEFMTYYRWQYISNRLIGDYTK